MAKLLTVEDASQAIAAGQRLIIAGDESLLRELPLGSWIGGTTPYFMTDDGAKQDREHLLVTELDEPVQSAQIQSYAPDQLERIPADYPAHGCSFIVMPTGSQTHLRFATECTRYEGLFNQPLVGWNAGAALENFDSTKPLVFDGQSGEHFENRAVVMHTLIDPAYAARIEIINPYTQGDGDVITFPKDGFIVDECFVNGTRRNFAEYLRARNIDVRWPLVADYGGASVNVSFRTPVSDSSTVALASPVFEGVEYRVAKPAVDLEQAFTGLPYLEAGTPAFSCNCVLNYLYANLEGKRVGLLSGPIAFGEIAYILLNQTLVYVRFERLV